MVAPPRAMAELADVVLLVERGRSDQRRVIAAAAGLAGVVLLVERGLAAAHPRPTRRPRPPAAPPPWPTVVASTASTGNVTRIGWKLLALPHYGSSNCLVTNLRAVY